MSINNLYSASLLTNRRAHGRAHAPCSDRCGHVVAYARHIWSNFHGADFAMTPLSNTIDTARYPRGCLVPSHLPPSPSNAHNAARAPGRHNKRVDGSSFD